MYTKKEVEEDVTGGKTASKEERSTPKQNGSQSNAETKESKTGRIKDRGLSGLSDDKSRTGDDEIGVAHSDTIVPDVEQMCTETGMYDGECDAVVPTQSVRLVHSVSIPPHQSVSVLIQTGDGLGPLLAHHSGDIDKSTGAYMDDALILPNQDGQSNVLVSNFTGFTQHLQEGEVLGQAMEAILVEAPSPVTPDSTLRTFVINTVLEGESKTDEISLKD